MKKVLVSIIALVLGLACYSQDVGSTVSVLSTNEDITSVDEVMLEGYSHSYKWNKDLKGDPVSFKEVWGYVMVSRLADYDTTTPLTDVGLFAAEVDCYGRLVSIPSRTAVQKFQGRVHLVAICESRSLTHFVLLPKSTERANLIKGLLKASEDFDGLQIDYELVPAEDGENFLSFLRELKKGLGKKMLSVCVPARTKDIKKDVYDYTALSKIADRVMIMAYDEHTTAGDCGSIASMEWCRKISKYALSKLPSKKLIIGIPFYGRTWEDERYHRAWAFNGINRILHENNVETISREDDIPYVKFKAVVDVTAWYEDAYSIVSRSRMYKEKGFENIAFWRMGQEDVAVWKWIQIE